MASMRRIGSSPAHWTSQLPTVARPPWNCRRVRTQRSSGAASPEGRVVIHTVSPQRICHNESISGAKPVMPRPPRLNRLNTDRAMSSHDQIAAILGTEILKGVHRAGDNMPPEPDLIKRFQVSRTVMREVTKTLAAKGFVVSKTRVGTRVRDPVHWNFFDADVLAWRVRIGLDDEFMRSLTEIRRALEPAAASLAAQ